MLHTQHHHLQSFRNNKQQQDDKNNGQATQQSSKEDRRINIIGRQTSAKALYHRTDRTPRNKSNLITQQNAIMSDVQAKIDEIEKGKSTQHIH